MSENIGLPPQLRSAIPTLKSESVLASCLMFFILFVVFVVTLVMSQQDTQRRKSRVRSSRAQRQKPPTTIELILNFGWFQGHGAHEDAEDLSSHRTTSHVKQPPSFWRQTIDWGSQLFKLMIPTSPISPKSTTAQFGTNKREVVSGGKHDDILATASHFKLPFGLIARSLMESVFSWVLFRRREFPSVCSEIGSSDGEVESSDSESNNGYDSQEDDSDTHIAPKPL